MELYLLKLHTSVFPTVMVACAFDGFHFWDAVEKGGELQWKRETTASSLKPLGLPPPGTEAM